MSKAINVQVEGIEDVAASIKRLSDKFKRREVNKILRKAAKPVAQKAQELVPENKGKLKKSIGVVTARGTQPGVYVTPRRKKGKYAGYHAHLVEFGVNPRTVKKSPKGHYNIGTRLGDMPAKPFLRPAWDTKKAEVFKNIKLAVQETADKHE